MKNGSTIKIGTKFNESELQYMCLRSDDGIVSYEAIACISATGDIMKPGEAITLRNNTLLLSCQLTRGVVKRILQQLSGCFYNGTHYAESERWVEPIKNNSCHIDSPMTGVLMKCFRPHYSFFEAQIAGCVAGDVSIPINSYGVLENRFVYCAELNGHGMQLIWVDESEVMCSFDGKTFYHNETWFDEERAAWLKCRFRNVYKNECVIRNETIAIGEIVKLDNGCSFSCHPQRNVYICDKKIADFNVIEKDESEHNDTIHYPFQNKQFV
ncbi:unnamed protein product [Toxocara canis]|uniref:Ig-like domain-containing protein n=1 Tax=Toxocara canis TaxID=6265 RepID=A0A183VAA4_TOXCA|nr:unnamed protein product [Toxocara canis]